jgi:signal transduction histidine kinase
LVGVDYAAVAFRSPAETLYRYRLLGLSEHWVEAGGVRQATYANLPAGDYTFEVMGANRHGYWSRTPARLRFRLEPWWYERPGYQAAMMLGGLALAGGAVASRLNMLRRRREDERRVALEQERSRLAKDLHDSLGASLTEMALLSRMGQAEALSAEMLTMRLDRLSERTQEAVRSLRDLIWMTNPKADSLEKMVVRICDMAERLLSAAGIRCRFDLPAELPERVVGPAIRRGMLLACSEAVNNAVRHAQAAEVWVRIAARGDQLEVRVEDDGCGFDPAVVGRTEGRGDRGLGLESLRQRMSAVGGACCVESTVGRGTRVVLRLPL